MSTLIVYYSQHGNNETLAQYLSGRVGCRLQRIDELKKRTGLTILLDLIFGRCPPIQPLVNPLGECEHVILIGPVWGGRIAAPLRSFLRLYRQQLQDYSFITLCGYENRGQAAGLSAELARRVGRPPRALAELRVSDLLPAAQRRNLRVVNSRRVESAELAQYQTAIDAFLLAALGTSRAGGSERVEQPAQVATA